MAKFPRVSPEVMDQVNQNERVIELVTKMIEATGDYIDEWKHELSTLHNAAEKTPVDAIVKLAQSVDQVVQQLQTFRQDGIEAQATNLADFMQQSQKAFLDMENKTGK